MYQLLADATLVLHLAFVLFVVLSVPLILFGGFRHWRWVRNPWFRGLHVAGIGIVVAQAWAGVVCPLTHLEMWFRDQAGQSAYAGSFVQHWLQRFLYYEAPGWVFVLVYSLFGMLVLLTWFLVPPRNAPGRAGSCR